MDHRIGFDRDDARLALWILLTLLAFTFLAGYCAGQAAGIRASNLTAHARRDVVRVTIPWAPGEYRGDPVLVGGVPAAATPFGAPWPESVGGGARYCAVEFPVRLLARETRVLPVHLAPEADTDARPTRFEVVATNRLSFAVSVGSTRVPLDTWVAIDGDGIVQVYRARSRIPGTTVWVEAHAEVLSGMHHARLSVRVGNSDPREPALSHQVGAVRVHVRGARVVLWYAGLDGVREWTTSEGEQHLELDPGGRWGDGQAIEARGVIVWPGIDLSTARALSELPVLAVATTWPESGALGPWGWVPDPPDPFGSDEALARAVVDWRLQPRGSRWWGPPHGLNPSTTDTGAQADFGTVKLIDVAHGWPWRIYSVGRSITLEAHRPHHLMYVDGSPVAYSTRPAVWLWHARPFSGGDLLGKSRVMSTADVRRSPRGQAWWGPDWEHDSANYLALYTALTADRAAMRECHQRAEVCLGTYRVRSGQVYLDSLGAPRAVGRSLLTMAQLYLVTGRTDLLERMNDRVDLVVAPRWKGGQVSGPVKPLGVRGGEPRSDLWKLFPVGDPRRAQANTWPFTMPWQDALGAVGLDACAMVTGNANARRIADAVARSVVAHGFYRDASCWHAVKSRKWEPDGQIGSPVYQVPYDPYGTWMMGAVQIARRADLARDPGADVSRHDAILARWRDSQSWTSLEWSAVR